MVSVSGTYSRPEGLSHCSTYPDAASLRNSEMHCPHGLKEAQSTIWKRANTLDFQRRSFKEQLANPHATMAGVPDKYNSLMKADQKFSIRKGPLRSRSKS